MNDRTEQVDDLQLVAMPSAVGCAEMFVRFSLTEWSLRDMRDTAAEAARVITEAVVSTANPATPGMVTARVRLSGADLIFEVETPRAVAAPAIPGVHRTGTTQIGPGRYVVWCALALPSGMSASAVPLPRRQRKPSQAARQVAPEEPMTTDPDVMRRILFGLNSPDQRP
ncbi:ATP-binding protein [Actinokineospora sp. HUAS TT18]|uniref:ATP-binding protein n=1 Tax=Actinokineospora sp. HUAS TT18 TaxID=3447451 RepID=UPI003F51B7CB